MARNHGLAASWLWAVGEGSVSLLKPVVTPSIVNAQGDVGKL